MKTHSDAPSEEELRKRPGRKPVRPGPGESERRAEIVERALPRKLPAAARNRPEKPGN
ncbi:MAG: hypothetical protein LBU32_11670 [Clostridiales bacterium]|nr:hypothetical protein [Clostridiales bacterium]